MERPLAKIVSLVGVAGGGMALFGSIIAMFLGGAGMAGGIDDSESFLGRSFGAAGMALLGGAAAIGSHVRLRLGGALMIISAGAGLLFTGLFYAPGAIFLLTSAYIAFRVRPDGSADEP